MRRYASVVYAVALCPFNRTCLSLCWSCTWYYTASRSAISDDLEWPSRSFARGKPFQMRFCTVVRQTTRFQPTYCVARSLCDRSNLLLLRVSIAQLCRARYWYSNSVCLSVCPCVTRWYCVETAEPSSINQRCTIAYGQDRPLLIWNTNRNLYMWVFDCRWPGVTLNNAPNTPISICKFLLIFISGTGEWRWWSVHLVYKYDWQRSLERSIALSWCRDYGRAIIFLPCVFFLYLLSSIFFSSPNLSRRRLDLPYFHTWCALVRI